MKVREKRETLTAVWDPAASGCASAATCTDVQAHEHWVLCGNASGLRRVITPFKFRHYYEVVGEGE
jgi:hypothetical protein